MTRVRPWHALAACYQRINSHPAILACRTPCAALRLPRHPAPAADAHMGRRTRRDAWARNDEKQLRGFLRVEAQPFTIGFTSWQKLL